VNVFGCYRTKQNRRNRLGLRRLKPGGPPIQ
jgi:hypothetical protein